MCIETLPISLLFRAQVLQFTHGVLVDLADVPGRAGAALGLLLAAATAASQEARAEIIAYEFFEQVDQGDQRQLD